MTIVIFQPNSVIYAVGKESRAGTQYDLCWRLVNVNALDSLADEVLGKNNEPF